MYLQCTTELTARQQRAVTDALYARLFTQPLTEIRITDLCRDADITRRIFYRLFHNKNDVLIALIDQILMELEQFPMPEEGNELHRILTYCKTHGEFMNVMLENNFGDLLMQRAIHYVMEENYSTQFWFRNGGEDIREEKILFLMNGMASIICRWHRESYRTSVSQIARTLERLLTQPLILPSCDPLTPYGG